MQIWHAGFIRAFIAGIVIAACPSALRAETTGEAYQRLARGINGLSYGDFLWQRPHSFCSESNPDLKSSLEHLDQAMAVKTNLGELTELAKHPDPKVRTLAMMRLYNMEEPAALRVIHSMAGDQADTFPSRSFLTQDHASNRMLLDTKPVKVGKLASIMLEQAGFPPLGMADSDSGGMIEDWTGWYQYLYLRATGNTDPIPKERIPKMAVVRQKIDALPPVTRAWMLLAIGTIDLHINDDAGPERQIPLFATEEELIAAAKQLGPDALLAFLRDGTRTGLRDPKCNGPKDDRGFILDHAGELFRKQDADALKSMGEIIAAADADPERASQLIREERDVREKAPSTYGRGKAIAAMLDLCGDRETDFIVRRFYEGLGKDDPAYEQQEFIRELKRRKPKEWKKTLRGIVAHPGFERLDKLTMVYFAGLTAELGRTTILTNQDNRDLPLPDVRNHLRAYFGLPELSYRSLEERVESVKPPVMTTKLPINAEFFELSPDGSILAAISREGHARLFSTSDGKPLVTLATEGEIRAVHFGRSDGRLMTLNRDQLLQTWDVATAKEITRTQSDSLAIYYDAIFSSSGEFLVTSPHQGFAVIDLGSNKPRWQIEMRTRGNGMFRLSPDDRRLAINDGFGKTIRFYDVATAKPVATLEGHADVPLRAEFSPDGAVFISWAQDNKVMIWDGHTGEFQRAFTCPAGLVIWSLHATDSSHFACPTKQGTIALFDVKTGIATRALSHSPEIGESLRCHTKALQVTEDGKKLIGLIEYPSTKRGQVDTYIEHWDLAK